MNDQKEDIVNSKAESPVIWDCELPGVDKSKPWTVGDKYSLTCRGDVIDKLVEPVQLLVTGKPKEEKKPPRNNDKEEAPIEDVQMDYALYILETKQIDNTSADFIVTSYKPGKYEDVKIKLVDKNKKELPVNPIKWEVTSVMTKETQNGFGPTQPMLLSLPWWYWLGVVGVILFIVGLIVLKIILFNKNKKLIKEIKSHATSLGAINQFYKDMRTLKSKYPQDSLKSDDILREFWEGLEYKFELFLIRKFEIAANTFSPSKTLKVVGKKLGQKNTAMLNNQLKRILNEFKKGNKAKVITFEDVEQMEVLCQRYVESIKKIKRKVN